MCLLERKNKKRYIYISYTCLCRNFKPYPGSPREQKGEIQIKGDDYMKKQLKDAALELAAAGIWLVIMFAVVCATVTLADVVNNLLTK